MFSLDAKYAKRVPEQWAAFAEVTSILPFAAIVQRRNQFVFGEIGVWRIATGVVLWFALVALHPLVYTVNPWRYVSYMESAAFNYLRPITSSMWGGQTWLVLERFYRVRRWTNHAFDL